MVWCENQNCKLNDKGAEHGGNCVLKNQIEIDAEGKCKMVMPLPKGGGF